MSEFKVGGKVICVKDHSEGVVKKGEIFTLLNIQPSNCKCNNWELDIGIRVEKRQYFYKVGCSDCCTIFDDDRTNIAWLSSSIFLPLDDFKEVSFQKLLEQMPVGAQ